jgi:signal transduction histidine kinase
LKKTYSLAVFIVLCSTGNSIAQDISYYQRVLDTVNSPLQKLTVLDSLISKSRGHNLDDFITYSESFIELATSMDSLEMAAKKVINVSYSLVSIKNDPERVLSLVDELLLQKEKIKSPFLLGTLYLKRGSANFRLNLEAATQDYADAISNFTNKDSIYIADAYLFSGQAYSNLGKFVPAGESYKKAYEYFEALKDYQYMNYAQQGITTMFSMNGFYDKAREEREKNIVKMKELGLDYQLVTIYYNQSLDDGKMGQRDKQLENLLKALSVIHEDNENRVSATDRIFVLSKLIEYYLEDKNLNEIEKYYALVKNNYDPDAKDLIYQSQYDELQSNYYIAHQQYEKALEHAARKMKAAKQMKYMEDIIATNELFSKIYAAKGDFKNALTYKDIYVKLEDSVYNKTTANSLAYYQTLYESEKKEREIVAKNASIQLLEKDNDVTRKKSIFITIALLLGFGVIILYRNRLQINQKKKLQEQFSQKLLISQEEERGRISKDLHDGLGQHLLLIKNKLIRKNDLETKMMVERAIEDVRTIARDLHPFQLQELGITRAIEMNLNQIDENTTLFISSEIDNIDHLFDKKQEMNLFRIVQESMNNILKHAHAEAGKVVLIKEKGGVKLKIKDNGIGFDFSDKSQNLRSLGLKTLLERTKLLNGQMRVKSGRNKGTTLEFYFPTQ